MIEETEFTPITNDQWYEVREILYKINSEHWKSDLIFCFYWFDVFIGHCISDNITIFLFESAAACFDRLYDLSNKFGIGDIIIPIFDEIKDLLKINSFPDDEDELEELICMSVSGRKEYDEDIFWQAGKELDDRFCCLGRKDDYFAYRLYEFYKKYEEELNGIFY